MANEGKIRLKQCEQGVANMIAEALAELPESNKRYTFPNPSGLELDELDSLLGDNFQSFMNGLKTGDSLYLDEGNNSISAFVFAIKGYEIDFISYNSGEEWIELEHYRMSDDGWYYESRYILYEWYINAYNQLKDFGGSPVYNGESTLMVVPTATTTLDISDQMGKLFRIQLTDATQTTLTIYLPNNVLYLDANDEDSPKINAYTNHELELQGLGDGSFSDYKVGESKAIIIDLRDDIAKLRFVSNDI